MEHIDGLACYLSNCTSVLTVAAGLICLRCITLHIACTQAKILVRSIQGILNNNSNRTFVLHLSTATAVQQAVQQAE